MWAIALIGLARVVHTRAGGLDCPGLSAAARAAVPVDADLRCRLLRDAYGGNTTCPKWSGCPTAAVSAAVMEWGRRSCGTRDLSGFYVFPASGRARPPRQCAGNVTDAAGARSSLRACQHRPPEGALTLFSAGDTFRIGLGARLIAVTSALVDAHRRGRALVYPKAAAGAQSWEYATPEGCASRNLDCFFRPIAPACQQQDAGLVADHRQFVEAVVSPPPPPDAAGDDAFARVDIWFVTAPLLLLLLLRPHRHY